MFTYLEVYNNNVDMLFLICVLFVFSVAWLSVCAAVETDQCHAAVETDQCHAAVETDQCHAAVETDQCHAAVETDQCHQIYVTVLY